MVAEWCEQEMDFFDEFWKSAMTGLGYAHVYLRKTKSADKNSHGLAIFFRDNKFERVKYQEVDLSELAQGFTGPQFEEVPNQATPCAALRCHVCLI